MATWASGGSVAGVTTTAGSASTSSVSGGASAKMGTVWWPGVYRANDPRGRIDVQILEPLVFCNGFAML